MSIPYNTLVVLAGVSLLGASAGLVGCFATLRRRALTGDALAHAALPGLCLAFLAVGGRSLPAMLLGAFLTGMLGIAVISLLRRYTRVKEDAAVGIVLSVFFGAGIVLERLIQNRSTEGSKAGLDSYILGKTAGMVAQDVYLIALAAAGSLLLIVILYKECKLTAFDPGFARVQGWPALALDLLLMALVAVAVVIGLPAVGVVMIAALLILPSVAARFWTDRLGSLLALSAGFGLLTGLVGTALSATFYLTPAGPIIVLTGSALFLLSALLAPRRGLFGRWLARERFRRELESRKLLRVLYDLGESDLPVVRPVPFGVLLEARSWSAPRLRHRLVELMNERLVRATPDDAFALTPAGLRRAADVARGQRLWELYLTEFADQASGDIDLASESVEDVLPDGIVEELTARLRASGRFPVALGGDAP